MKTLLLRNQSRLDKQIFISLTLNPSPSGKGKETYLNDFDIALVKP
jgi:hypothetical protein